MLEVIRTQPNASAVSSFLDASVIYRDGVDRVEGYPDIVFSMRTYQKIGRANEEQEGDGILLPLNLFFKTLSDKDLRVIYDMYRFSKAVVAETTIDNLRETQKVLQNKIFDTVQDLDLSEKMVEFCKSDWFVYPDLSLVGTLPHHSPAKTFKPEDYIEITAISIFSKMMVPIWGEFIQILSDINVKNTQREKLVFDLIEPTLEEGAFERIYKKLSYFSTTLITDRRKGIDGRGMNASTSFVLTHSALDDQMFEAVVMATIVVKRMATYDCFVKRKDNQIPNAMVYIDDGIKRTVDTKIVAMRNEITTIPRHELPQHDTEDNSSILDHASKTSKKSIDIPIFVETMVEYKEIDRLIVDTGTPVPVFEAAAKYYEENAFEPSPLCQAMVASFIGTRFGGSKPIGYLTPSLHQKVVVILQVYLIRQGLFDLAALVSSKTSPLPIDGATPPIAVQINSKLMSDEYLQCQTLFKGYLEKPIIQFGKKNNARKVEADRIDFVNHITKMIEWLVRYTHTENMAPVLWEYSHQDNHPLPGEESRYDADTVRRLCQFYLQFHSGKRPF